VKSGLQDRNGRGRRRAVRRSTNRRGARSFVLLEILVAMALLGIAMAATLRCYTNSLKALSEDRRVTQGVLLAQSILEDFEIEAPENEHVEGNFAPDFPEFSYVADFESVEIRYRDLELRLSGKKFDPLRKVKLDVFYQALDGSKFVRVVHLETYLTGLEKYAPNTKVLNALY
jgi:hypothetical protein